MYVIAVRLDMYRCKLNFDYDCGQVGENCFSTMHGVRYDCLGSSKLRLCIEATKL